MARPPRLETPRLVLEPLTPDVARAVVAGRPAPLPLAAGWPLAETADTLRLFAEHAQADDDGGWLVVLRETGEVIGDCGWRGGPDATGTAEIGYGVAPTYRGQGYGREAVEAMVQWCRSDPATRRLTASVHPDNAASRRLVERLGFRLASTTGTALLYELEARRCG